MGNVVRNFGMAIKKLRQEKGISQEKLAELSKLHRTYIGFIERSERNVSLEVLDKLSDGLEMPISKIFEYVENQVDTEE